jgi:hypothetical protein
MRPLSSLKLADFSPVEVLGQLLDAIFDAHTLSSDHALELLLLTEYIQSELYRRHGDELRALHHPGTAFADEVEL